MKKHKMRLAINPFKEVVNGKKEIESRLYDEKRQKVNVGDQIEFICKDDSSKKVLTKVKAIYLYNSFEELFSDFSPERFGGNSKQGLIEEVNKFYSKEEQQKYNVVAIKIELVK